MLARIEPSGEFRVETRGCGCPVGQTVRYPRDPALGATVTLMVYAAAVGGMPQELEAIGIVRVVPPATYVPTAPRVSITRHGVTGTNCSATGCVVASSLHVGYRSPLAVVYVAPAVNTSMQ